jgi:hypothetical protein
MGCGAIPSLLHLKYVHCTKMSTSILRRTIFGGEQRAFLNEKSAPSLNLLSLSIAYLDLTNRRVNPRSVNHLAFYHANSSACREIEQNGPWPLTSP